MNKKIQKSNVEDIIELNMVQKGMLYHYLKDADQNIYNVQLAFKITGDLHVDLLQEAFRIVQSRNEALRSVFRWEGLSKPVQIILKEHPVEFRYHANAEANGKDRGAYATMLSEIDQKERFDLTKLPIKVRVIQMGADSHLLNISNHHILYDGWSTNIFLRELFNCYNTLQENKTYSFPLKAAYKDVQVGLRNNVDSEEKKQFWKKYLEGHDTKPYLPVSSGKMNGTHQVKKHRIGAHVDQLDRFTKKQRVTKAAVIYTAYSILIQRYSDETDVVFGTTVSNRNTSIRGTDQLIGNFINTIPLRVNGAGDMTLVQLVRQINQDLIARTSFHDSSLHEVNQVLDLQVSGALFDSVVGIENYPLDTELMNMIQGLDVKLESVYENTNVSLVFLAFFKERLELEINYKESTFPDTFIRLFADNFLNVLHAILAESGQTVASVQLMSDTEKKDVLVHYNATTTDFQCDKKTIVGLFCEQLTRTPDKLAVVCGDRNVTYEQLNTRANQLANALIRNGVATGDVIMLMTDPSIEMIVGMLGIMKAGAAYLPVGPEFPKSRIDAIYADAACKILLTEKHLLEKSADGAATWDLTANDIYHQNNTDPDVEFSGEDLAYLIYTSGTTGTPKGVKICHRNMVNYQHWLKNFINLSGDDKTALITSFAFDLGYTSLFSSLLFGAELHLLPRQLYTSTTDLLRYIKQNGMSYLKMTPSLYSTITAHPEFVDGIAGVRTIILGGEKIRLEDIEKTYVASDDIRIINHYGPTETTVGCIAGYVDRDMMAAFRSQPFLGRPINNTQCYILDRYGNLAPVFCKGELFIGGEGVGKGYAGSNSLTNEKFVRNPFLPGGLMYKTGDLARWLPDGHIEFFGRIDNQVKVRGYRVELSEIECQLSQHLHVKEVVVIDKSQDANSLLVAYYVSDRDVPASELNEHLSRRLPEYMIPSFYVRLSQMPLTANGKLNKKALPDPELSANQEYMAPATDIESKLVQIWSQVLKLPAEKISVCKSFTELGGHSLKIILMLNKILKEFNVLVPINDFFNHSDIRSLALYMQHRSETRYATIGKASSKEHYRLSSAQKRLFFLYEFDKSSVAYNSGTTIRLEGALDIDRLTSAFGKLIARHEILRTGFSLLDEGPRQRVIDTVDFHIERFDTSAETIQETIAGFIRPFDLAQPPLLRVGLMRVSDNEHILVVDIHHIISDGISQDVFIKDFVSLYKGEALSPLPFQYKDYAEWQEQSEQQRVLAKQKKFWIGEFSDEPVPLELPTDFVRPQIKSYEGAMLHFEIDAEQTRTLRAIASQEGATTFMVLLAAYTIFLAKLTNQDDITVGIPSAGRQHPDLENMIGMFVNTLALRNHVDNNVNFKTFLGALKSKALACFDNQSYPYEELVEAMGVTRNTARNPLFDTMFFYENYKDSVLEIPGVAIKPFDKDHTNSKFDISLIVTETASQILFDFEYATRLFRRSTVERFVGYFKEVLLAIQSNEEIKLSDIELLPQSERNEIVYAFNDTDTAFDKHQTIPGAFEEMVRIKKDAPALTFEGTVLSYEEVNKLSNAIAHKISALGVRSGEVVGILMARSRELIPAILGILKSGCAYLPLDPAYPLERLRYIVHDSKLRLILTDPSAKAICDQLQVAEVMDATAVTTSYHDRHNPPVNYPSSSLAYLIYTSGSTGNPKGVMIEHKNVLNFVEGMRQRIPFTETRAILCNTTMSFDIFVLEIIVPLLTGLRIVLSNSKQQQDVDALMTLMEEEQADVVQITPSYLKILLAHGDARKALRHVRILVVGGEQFPGHLLDMVRESFAARIFNMYGPTETCVWSTASELTNTDEVTIGTPIANTSIRILNRFGKLQPIGVAGELCIGGEGVSRGYWQNAPLTAAKFLPDPVDGKSRIYHTGDLSRWLPDGNIEFMGRMDNQIKLRGYRIEPGEIEYQLGAYDGIKEAVVIVKERKDGKYLVAYYVAHEPIETAALLQFLKNKLPVYMVPSHYVHLSALPLTPNRKLDRKLLPDPEIAKTDVYAAPESEAEKILVRVWSDILGLSTISVDDNFFAIGGDSIKSIQLCSRVRTFGFELTVQDVFHCQTIRELAPKMRTRGNGQQRATVAVPRAVATVSDLTYKSLTLSQLDRLQEQYSAYGIEDIYPLSPMQEGMLFHSELESNSGSYFGQTTCELVGTLDVRVVEESLNELVNRHDILRTVFVHADYERPLQVVLKERKISLRFADASGCLPGEKQSLIGAHQQEERSQAFDLSADALMRVRILRISEREHVLIWSHHHVLMDGWCMGIIVNEFRQIYSGKINRKPVSLPATVPYSRYITWLGQRQKKRSGNYWKDYLQGYESLSGLPKKSTRSKEAGYSLESYEININKETTGQLTQVSRKYGVSLNTIFQFAWGLLLSRYNNTGEAVFGSVVSGRPAEVEGIESMVGLFINTVPVRITYAGPESSVAETLKEMQRSAIEGAEHHYHPLSEIQSLSPLGQGLIDHIITFQNLPANSLLHNDRNNGDQFFKIRKPEFYVKTSYDLSVTVYPSDVLDIRIDYNTNRYQTQIIKEVALYLNNILKAVAYNPGLLVRDVSLYDEAQKRSLEKMFTQKLEVAGVGTIQEKLKKSFKAHSHRVAVEYDKNEFTYSAIEAQANSVASLLNRRAVPKGAYVGVLCDDRSWVISSFIGLLKGRIVFVPLEPGLPKERLATMVNQIGCRYIITDQTPEDYQQLDNVSAGITWITTEEIKTEGAPDYDEEKAYEPDDIIYVYFTSGTTGVPKAVAGKNKGLSHFIGWEIETFAIDSSFRFSQFTNLGFDASLRDLFVPLCSGATICIPDQSGGAGNETAEWISRQRINLIHCVPSIFKLFSNPKVHRHTFPDLKYVLLAGEKIVPQELAEWFEVFGTRVQLVNLYGATETTLVKSFHLISADDLRKDYIPVSAMPGAQLLILDNNFHVCPCGGVGEIYIRTPYRTAGYLQSPSPGAPFIASPYNNDTSAVLYKTGDLGRSHGDAKIEILGRKDHQVKVRGVRIELEDIQANILRYPGVRDVVVAVKEDISLEKIICAYVVSEHGFDSAGLMQRLSDTLPSFMVPAFIIPLARLPLSRNGKVDRKALPDPETKPTSNYTAPENEVEIKLTELWGELFKIDPNTISTTSSFFEMGAQSLKLMLFINKINRAYDIKVPLQQIFNKQTIRDLAEFLITVKQMPQGEPKHGSEPIEITL